MTIAKCNQVQLSVAIWKQIQFLNAEGVWFEHKTKMKMERKGDAS
jgi:alkylated DNA nucleotide flippase Atl1